MECHGIRLLVVQILGAHPYVTRDGVARFPILRLGRCLLNRGCFAQGDTTGHADDKSACKQGGSKLHGRDIIRASVNELLLHP